LAGGPTTTDPAQAEELLASLDVAEARERLALGTRHLREHRRVGGGKVGAVGFSMGGDLVLRYAATGDLDAVVAYYAALEPDRREPIPCPVLLQLAEVDEFEPPDTPATHLDDLRQGGTDATARTWPGTQHSFANPDVAPYDRAAATSAWADSVAFLGRHLRR